MQRRTLLQLGLGGAAVLALAGGGLALLQPGVRDGRLTPAARNLFAAVGRAVLDGRLPAETAARDATMAAHLDRLDATVAGFPPALRSELSDLVALLSAVPGRLALAGLRTAWSEASVAEVQSALQQMRMSSLALRQQAYHALRDLTLAAYYADAATWPQLGYPGPNPVAP
jgi:hypothetical protein